MTAFKCKKDFNKFKYFYRNELSNSKRSVFSSLSKMVQKIN